MSRILIVADVLSSTPSRSAPEAGQALMRAVLAVDAHLTDALDAAHPEREILSRIKRLFDVELVLATREGTPLETTGVRLPPSAVCAVAQRDDAALAHAMGRRAAVFAVPGDDGDGRRLAVIGLDAGSLNAIHVRRAADLLAILMRRRVHERVCRHGAGDALFDDARALDAAGVTFQQPVQVAAWSAAGEGRAAAWAACDRLTAHGVPHVLRIHDDHALALVEGDPRVLARVLTSPAGIGRAIDSLATAPQSLCDARVGLAQARVSNAVPATVRFDELDAIAHALLPVAADRRWLDRIAGALDPLQSHPSLLATLAAWIACDHDIHAATLHVGVHRNTFRQRLARIERLLSRRVTSVRHSANLHLALLAADVRASMDDVPRPLSPAAVAQVN